MKSVAITGGVACGKTTLAKKFIEQGFPVFNCDDEIRKLYQHPKILGEIQAILPNIFDGKTLNKEKLRHTLSKPILKKLEGVLYPYLIKTMKAFKIFYRRKNYEIIFFEVPLLFEKNWHRFFDGAIFIHSNRRVRQRNFITRGGNIATFHLLNSTQWCDDKKLSIAKKMGYKILPLNTFSAKNVSSFFTE